MKRRFCNSHLRNYLGSGINHYFLELSQYLFLYGSLLYKRLTRRHFHSLIIQHTTVTLSVPTTKMTYTSLLLVTIIVVVSYHNIEAAPQFFGGVQSFPGGGRSQQAGYQAGPAWGSLSQSSNGRGQSSPITYSGGVNAYNPAGTGIGANLAVQPGIGGQGSVRGQFGHQVGDHNANIFAQHDRYLDKNLRPIGPETNSAGINYSNKNGASAFISGSQTNGAPARGTVGGSIPIVTGKNGGVSATGQTTFGHGMKPIPQVGVQAS